MLSTNLKILDQEFIFAEKVILAYMEVLQSVGMEYIKVLHEVSSHALQVPAVNQKLVILSEAISTIINSIENVSNCLQGSSVAFINNIDEKDDFLY